MKSFYDCVLFDLDGTLIDTIELIYQCYRLLFLNRFKYDVKREDIIPYIGIPLKDQFLKHIPDLSEEELSDMADEFMNYQYSLYKEYLKPVPGSVETLKELKKEKIKTGVVTSRRKNSAILYCDKTGLRLFLDIIVAVEDTQKHKPHPEPVIRAISTLNVLPERTLFVGDAVFDIEAGIKAGVDTAFACWGSNSIENLTPTPKFFFKSFDEVLSLVLCNNLSIKE